MSYTKLFCILILSVKVAYSQNDFSVSFPITYSKVEMKNNWNPPTAINRKEKFAGTSLGCGVNFAYSFHPTFIPNNKSLSMNLGTGYFKQRFNVERPFDYATHLQPIVYTDSYSYHCLHFVIGASYKYHITSNFSLTGNLSYNWFRSFRQDYTPTSKFGYSNQTQTNYNKINFGKSYIISAGINRNIDDRLCIALNLLVPSQIRWRNDPIFKDPPTTFTSPKFSLGSSVSLTYILKGHSNPNS